MNNNKQIQKAGDGANQYQANTIIFNGIDEKRAREICNEIFDIARKDLTSEAYDIACQRVNEFENDLIPRMQKIEGALDHFRDPSFQFMMTNAHRTAASTDRPTDYALLSELLIHRIQRGENRTTVAGIGRAIEIVDKVSDDALLALSVVFAVQQYAPANGNISQGLDILDNLFGKLCYDKLPTGDLWLDHLDILDAVRMSTFGNLKKFEDYYAEKLSGYCAIGIHKDSENLEKAKKIIADFALPNDILIPNYFNSDFFRLPIVNENGIENISFPYNRTINGIRITIPIPATSEQKQALHEICSLYSKDKNILEDIKKQFLEELLKRQHLALLRNWWNNIPTSFNITAVGKVLAHANAKRCDSSLPDLN